MWHATYARIRHGKGRLVLTVLAVAMGVTFLTASLVLADSTQSALDDSYAQVYAGVDIVVRGPEAIGESAFSGGGAPLPDSMIERIREVSGVARAEGRISTVAQLTAAGEGVAGEAAIATAVPEDPGNAAVDVRSGRLPLRSGEVAVDAAAAATLELEPGDTVEVLLPDGVADAMVVGTVGFGRLDALAGGARVLFDRDTAAHLFDDAGFAEIVVHADQQGSIERLRERLTTALGDDARVLTATAAARRDAAAAASQTQLVSRIVLAVAVVALLIGGSLIANTFRMLVGQRVRELALLRAVGASRRQVAGSLLAEAALTGSAGSVLGVALGVGAGMLLVETSEGLMPGLPPVSPTVTPFAVLTSLVVGIAVALLAARGAARRALAVPPVAAMRTIATPDTGLSRRRTAAGSIMLTAGIASVTAGITAGTQMPLLAGAAGTIVGAGLLFPLVTGPLLAVLSRPLRRAGVTGSLARQQTLAAPRRAGATAAALAVTLGLVTLLLVFNASLGAATPRLLEDRQHADYTIRSTAREGLHDTLFRVADRLRSVPEVATAEVITYGEVRVTDPAIDASRPRTASMYVVDPAAVADLFDVRDDSGHLADLSAGELAVRDTVAAANGWQPGDVLSAEFPDGTTSQLTVSALFNGSITTDWITAPGTAEGHLPAAYREAFVRLADGVSQTDARPALEQVVGDLPSTQLLSRDEQAVQAAEANESSLGILTALFSLSLVIGVLGVMNTLTFSVLERVREVGLLRAVGATQSQIRSMIRWEAALTSALGAIVGATLGLVLAWIATHALPDQSPAFTVPVAHLAIAVLATITLGSSASLLPAIRASRIELLQAVQAQ